MATVTVSTFFSKYPPTVKRYCFSSIFCEILISLFVFNRDLNCSGIKSDPVYYLTNLQIESFSRLAS